jgi:Xaa-Pro aminopeptidase
MSPPAPQEKLAAFCRGRNYDGALLRRRSSIAWLTGGADTHIDLGSPLGIATVVWTPRKKTVHTDIIEAARLRAEEFSADWEIIDRPWTEREPSLPPDGGRYATDWPDDQIAELRWSLSAPEIDTARALGAEAAAALAEAMRLVSSGATEHELAGLVAGGLQSRGILSPVLLVASDDRIARFRHPIPTSKRIERIVMAAICAQRKGLTVSATRIVHFGPMPADLRRRHDAVCKVDSALHHATRPGVRWCDALAAGINAYRDTGFEGEWKLHHQGGPMGYDLRDFKATPTQTRPVLDSQLVGWNPSITGTKSEDTILVTAAGCEVITPTPDWPVGPEGRPDILVRSK